jgi:hypothetical protein
MKGEEMGKNDSKVTRRDLLKSATIAGAGLRVSAKTRRLSTANSLPEQRPTIKQLSA